MKYGNTNPWGLGPQNISSHSNPGHLGPREKFLTIQLGYTSICSAPAFTFVTKYWTEHCPLHAVVIFDNIIACQKQCSIFVASALVFISYYVCTTILTTIVNRFSSPLCSFLQPWVKLRLRWFLWTTSVQASTTCNKCSIITEISPYKIANNIFLVPFFY